MAINPPRRLPDVAPFCAAIREELGATSEGMRESWARGALSIVQLYANLDSARFDEVLQQLARGAARSALADGARWLVPRWRQESGDSTADPR